YRLQESGVPVLFALFVDVDVNLYVAAARSGRRCWITKPSTTSTPRSSRPALLLTRGGGIRGKSNFVITTNSCAGAARKSMWMSQTQIRKVISKPNGRRSHHG